MIAKQIYEFIVQLLVTIRLAHIDRHLNGKKMKFLSVVGVLKKKKYQVYFFIVYLFF